MLETLDYTIRIGSTPTILYKAKAARVKFSAIKIARVEQQSTLVIIILRQKLDLGSNMGKVVNF